MDGVRPAQERLHAGDPAGREIELRLVVQRKLVARERSLESRLEAEADLRSLVHGRIEECKFTAPVSLRTVHRNARLPQQ